MTQTAISALQEYLQKNSYNLPTYTLVNQLGPQHQVAFTVRVSFNSYSADGTAKTKQAAKHNAASAMIKLLNTQPGHYIDFPQSAIDISPTQFIVQNENTILYNDTKLPRPENNQSETSPSINSIGMLQEICAQRKMTLPTYEECDSRPRGGFTFQCKLGTLIQEATGPSKKQAKQKSAELMRQYLIKENLAIDNKIATTHHREEKLNVLVFQTGKLHLSDSMNASTRKAKELFPNMKKNIGISIEEKSDMSIVNFHNQLRNSFDPTDVIKFLSYYKSLKFDELRSTIENSEYILKNIENILHIQTKRRDMKTDGSNKYLVSIEFLSKPAPVFREVGKGNSYDEAYSAALVRTITGVHLLLL